MKGLDSPLKIGRPHKKVKRSESASSLSTVRSLSPPPAPPADSGAAMERSISASSNPLDAKIKSRGPKLHLFQSRGSKLHSAHKQVNGFVTSSPISRPEVAADATENKRRNLRKQHDVEVRESSVRRSPAVKLPPHTPFTGASKAPARAQQTQLRNGTIRRNVNEDSDDGLSPPPDVLRPPEGIERRVTRGGTPSQPYRIVKKGGARIKTS